MIATLAGVVIEAGSDRSVERADPCETSSRTISATRASVAQSEEHPDRARRSRSLTGT